MAGFDANVAAIDLTIEPPERRHVDLDRRLTATGDARYRPKSR